MWRNFEGILRYCVGCFGLFCPLLTFVGVFVLSFVGVFVLCFICVSYCVVYGMLLMMSMIILIVIEGCWLDDGSNE